MFFFFFLFWKELADLNEFRLVNLGEFHFQRKPYFLVLSSGFFVEFFGDEKSLEEWPDCRNEFL